jgi:hypothetical protein
MRIAVRTNESRNVHAVSADLFHHITKDAERGGDLDWIGRLRGVDRSYEQRECGCAKKQASVHR